MGLVPVDQVMGLPMIVGAHTSDEVQFALNWASSAVESYCEREFGQKLADTVVVDPYYSHVKAMPSIAPMSSYGSYPGYGVSFSAYGSPYIGTAMLANPPVTNVSSVMAWMPMATQTGETGWVELVNYQWAEDGLIWDTSGMPGVVMSDGGPVPSWPRMPRSLQITYDHGFVLPGAPAGGGPPLPDGVQDAVIAAAAYFLANPTGAVDERTGDVSTKWSDRERVAGILDSTLLGKYRLVHL
ncbi:hypothetical protein ACAG26_24335 [Mycobacterium sp. pUA109]|uniref:hypothetical protein n=1 Tax=Mycobacterium sp. pUA109 TaxID=3238982 RepID=UPI00351B13BC